MKKLTLLMLLVIPFIVKGKNYTSIANGDWNSATTWSPSGIPASSDTVTITNSVTVSVANERATDITINSGGTLTVSSGYYLYIYATLAVNSGGNFSGAGNAVFVNSGVTIMNGSGSYNKFSGTYYFVILSGTDTIGSSVSFSSSANFKFNNGGSFFVPMTVINLGKISLVGGQTINNSGNSGAPACTWINGTNADLYVSKPMLTNSVDVLNATAAGNTVEFSGAAAYTIKQPVANTFYNLNIYLFSKKSLPSDITVSNNFTYTYESSTSFDMAGHNMTIGGNWTNNCGGSILNEGTVTFNGSSTQTIGGSKSTRFTNMTVSGSGNVNIAVNSAFTGVLTLSGNGNLTSSAGIYDTLVSTSSATARVAQITGGGTITANFAVQRYDGRTKAAYEILTTPVQSTTLGDWDNNSGFWMSGVGGNDGNSGSYVSVYLDNETTNTYDKITLYATPGDSYVLPQGEGLYLWMGNSLSSMSPFTYITHGVPSVGTISHSVTYTSGKGNGFNLIGNPYPSPIDWSTFLADNPTLQSSYYIFEQDGSYHTFSSGSIPIEQGFGIVTSSSTTLTFKESHKTATDAALQRAGNPENEPNAVTFTLSDDANAYSCPTIISFGADYVQAYNPDEDALFIKSPIDEVPELYTTSNDRQNLCLNRLPDNADVVDVPLMAIGNVAANYTLTAGSFANLGAYNCVCLIDEQTGQVLNNFEDNPSYTFAMSQPGQQRNFVIEFRQLAAGESCNSPASVASMNTGAGSIEITPAANGAEVNFQLSQPENATISVYNIMGQKVLNDINLNAYQSRLGINLPSTGQIYIIRVVTEEGITVKKLYY